MPSTVTTTCADVFAAQAGGNDQIDLRGIAEKHLGGEGR